MKIIADQDDLYLYFEIIRQTEARSVLDYGMFLKRAGAIARQVKDQEISGDIRLVGVDFEPGNNLGIYETIYDEICKREDFLQQGERNEVFDLAVFLRVRNGMRAEEARVIQSWLKEHARYAVTDWDEGESGVFRNLLDGIEVRQVTAGKNRYAFLKVRG